MPKVLIISHSPVVTTGYGRVARQLAHALHSAGHQLAALGTGAVGGAHGLPYPVFPLPTTNADGCVERALASLRPDIVLTIGDPWMFRLLPAVAQREPLTWIAYFPMDAYPLPPEWFAWVAASHHPIVFSRFAQRIVHEATGISPALIYHGVDTNSFRPVPKERAKELANVSGSFVVGTVARNQQRKNLPALVRAFAMFAKDKPDAVLYLHTQVAGHWDMLELVRRFGVEDKTRVTEGLGTERGIPDAMLATVYNAMDVFVLPTMAEGFGLPIMEAQACVAHPGSTLHI